MRIAIIDDNQVNITLIQHLLRTLDAVESVPFTDSASGLAWCMANQPDLVIVDYMMPEPDGLEFTRAFRASVGHENTPVVMITANTDEQIRHQALELGCTDFLTKPIDRTEFVARVRNMLALQRYQQALADRATWLAEEVRKATADIRARELEAILRLAKTAEFRDPETGAHILRMAQYSRHIARQLGCSEEEQETVFAAAPMHDIGKVGIPDHILLKKGPLRDEEREWMRKHPAIGHEILKDSPNPFLQAGAVIALTHHERWDGAGYPQRLAGEAIPLMGRITAVADIFDALTSARPYKPAWPMEKALQFLQDEKGHHLCPACVDAFLSDMREPMHIAETYRDTLETDNSDRVRQDGVISHR